MVGSVQNSLGSSAYIKGSQLGSGSSASSFRKELEERPSDSESVRKSRDTEKTERSTDSKDSLFTSSKSTQLEARNDNETLQAEQVRGSLLDISV